MAHRNNLILATVLTIAITSLAGTWIASPGKGSHASALQTASNNFTGYANGALLESQSGWASVNGSIEIGNNGTTAGFWGNSAAVNAMVRYTAGTWSANQSTEGTWVNVNGTIASRSGLAVRCTASNDGYGVIYSDGNVYLLKINGGTVAGIGSAIALTPVTGDKLKLQVTGTGSATRLALYKDTGSGWTAMTTNVDPGGTYISAGNPGVAGFSTAIEQLTLSNWFATDL